MRAMRGHVLDMVLTRSARNASEVMSYVRW